MSSADTKKIDQPSDLLSLIESYANANRTAAQEFGLLSIQPEEKQATFAARLREIDRYLRLEKRGNAEADVSAAALGMKRRHFLRLIAKLTEVGPVKALIPKLQEPGARPSVVRDGLGKEIEGALAEILGAEPDAKLARAQAELDRLLPPDVSRPSFGTLRRRLQVLRGAGIDRLLDKPFGQELIVDQSSTTMPVRTFTDEPDYAVATLIVDRATTLIVGGAISASDGIGTSVRTAIDSAEEYLIPKMRDYAFPVALELSRVDWIVPPGLEEQALQSGEVSTSTPLVIHAEGARRHGDLLLRTVGDRLGPYELRVRQTADLEGRAKPGGVVLFITEASDYFYELIDEYNAKRIEQLRRSGGYKPDPDPATRTERLDRLGNALAQALRRATRLPDEFEVD